MGFIVGALVGTLIASRLLFLLLRRWPGSYGKALASSCWLIFARLRARITLSFSAIATKWLPTTLVTFLNK